MCVSVLVLLWCKSCDCIGGVRLKDEIAAVHRVVKVLATDVFDAVQIEPADVGMVDSAGARRFDHVGAVRRRQGVQRDRVLALGPGQCAAPDAVR